jgi:hypothetical protein
VVSDDHDGRHDGRFRGDRRPAATPHCGICFLLSLTPSCLRSSRPVATRQKDAACAENR